MTNTIPEVPAGVEGAIAGEVSGAGNVAAVKGRSLWANAWIELRRNPMFWIASFLILVFVVMAAFPQLFTDKDPTFADLSKARQPPSSEAWFGYDAQGYDVYARTIYGARSSILVGLLATIFTLVFGSLMGIIAGFFGGGVDAVLSRIGDIFFAIPLLLGGILVLYTFPSNLETPYIVVVLKVVIALSIVGWPNLARLMRSSVLQVKPNDYVQAARALGASPSRIITSHILPELAGPRHRRLHHQPRGLHLGRGDPVVPGDRASAAGDLLGSVDLAGLGHRPDPDRPAHVVVPVPLLGAHRAVVHHAG